VFVLYKYLRRYLQTEYSMLTEEFGLGCIFQGKLVLWVL